MNSNDCYGKTHLASLDIKAGGYLNLYSLACPCRNIQHSNITSSSICYQADCKRSIGDKAYSCKHSNIFMRSIISKYKRKE